MKRTRRTLATAENGPSAGGDEGPAQLAHNRPVQGNNGEPAGDGDDWSAYGSWIQLSSRSDLDDAEALAVKYHRQFKETRIFTGDGGEYVVVLGPYPPAKARSLRNDLVDSGDIPRDSRVNDGNRFVDLVWGIPPEASN